MKLRLHDEVMVVRGKDKNTKGTIIAIDNNKGKVRVQGVRVMVKNTKPRNGQPGKQEKVEAFIDASNVMLLDPTSGKPTRVSVQRKDKKVVRMSKKSGKAIEAGKKAEKKASATKAKSTKKTD